MKKTSILWFGVWVLVVVTRAPSARDGGLILENDYPQDEIVRIAPFTTERSRGPNDSGYKRYFTDNSGKTVSIDIRYIAGIVTFLDFSEFQNITSELSLTLLLSKKAELEAVAAKVPRARLYVRDPVRILEAEIKRFRSGERKVKGKWLTAAEYERFQVVIDGVHYDNVELLSAEDTFVTFRYEGGKIAHISWKKLTPDQIISLNGTSQAHIDANWRQKAEQVAGEMAAAEQQRIQQWAQEKAEKKRSMLAVAHSMEEAARYDEALKLYKEAGAQDEVRRLSRTLAVEFEKKGSFAAAEEYFEAAGASAEADRVRQSHGLSDPQIFNRAVPAVVAVVAKNGNEGQSGSG